jgi:phosphatidylinositol dimannoside acyltransferase
VSAVGRVASLLSGRASTVTSDRLADVAYAGGWQLVRALPEPVARRLFDAGADLAVRRGGKAVDRLRANLSRVAPGQDLVGPAMRSYARYWLEVFRLPSMPVDDVVARTEVVDEHHLREAQARGRGVVLALPHSGNWDTAAVWLIGTGTRFTTVAERLRPESLFDRFVAFREGLGMEVLPLTGGERPPFDVMVERLEAGGVLCLLADRDLSARGVEVAFFGAATRMPAGPATLALRTGAPLVPVHLSFTERGWRIRFFAPVPPSDVAAMTQAMADAFAAGIAEHPADWHMLQRLWLEDLEPRP